MPFASIIDESYIELGDYLKKGDSIVKIVDLDPLHINLTANENEINKIRLNQQASKLLEKIILLGELILFQKLLI